MPTLDWLGAPYPSGWVSSKATARAYSTERHINDKPTSITLLRGEDWLDPQTVRVELSGGTRNVGAVSVDPQQTYQRGVVLFGLRGHATLDDFDVQIGDRFGYALDGVPQTFEVTGVTAHAGEIQAHAERVQT